MTGNLAQDLIDQHMRDNQGKPVMQLVMGGKFAQQIICRGLPYKSEKEEEFYQVDNRSTSLLSHQQTGSESRNLITEGLRNHRHHGGNNLNDLCTAKSRQQRSLKMWKVERVQREAVYEINRSDLKSAFWQVSIDVRGKRTLEESLDFYVQGELMEGDNQYLCEELGKKVRPT